MKSELRPSMLAAVGALMGIALAAYPTDAGSEASSSLAAPESFASIADEGQRSAAYFTELGKVLLNPRCVNCHPAGDRPRQGDLARLHQPLVAKCHPIFARMRLRCRG
jgi:cytochrome c5